MSAARTAARVKPVIAIKSGRHDAGVKEALSHTGALAGSDAVYDAALHRAGILRVLGLDEMFAAAETLSRVAPFRGDRLAVVTNGGGIGVLAVDRLADLKGNLAALAPATIAAIDAKIPTGWSRGNPVDIIGDAGAERYSAAMDAVMRDTTTDAVLVINCPTALAAPQAIAAAVIEAVKKRRTEMIPAPPVFAVWLGASPNVEDQFQSAGIPHFSSETDASSGFMYLVNYNRAQTALMRTPPSLPAEFTADADAARRIVAAALTKGRSWLDPVEATALLGAYGIPVAPVLAARTPEQAGEMARPLIQAGAKVAAKILSQQIPHKSDLGGVVLNLDTEATVINAARKMLDDIARLKPDAHLDGVTIQPMVHWPGAHELIAGIADDPNFGPVVVFGHGGTAAEVIGDKALALPPLDLHLAHDLIARTRIAAVLRGYRNVAPANIEAVALVLVKLAQLCADIPEIRELDLNPLLANAAGVIAIDARVRIEPIAAGTWHGGGNPRCAIRPYPKEWERRLVTSGGAAIAVRPVRPEDEPLYVDFFAHVSLEDRRLRFFAAMKTMDHNFVARLTQIDYARAMAFVALDPASGALLGVVRLHIDANHEEGEFAVLVRTDLKGQGLGWSLMQLIIDYARADGVKVMKGQILAENTTMSSMCAELGFSIVDESAGADTKLAMLIL